MADHKFSPAVAVEKKAIAEKLKTETSAPTTVKGLADRVADIETVQQAAEARMK